MGALSFPSGICAVCMCCWTLTPLQQGPGHIFVITAGTLNTRGWVVSRPYC